MVINEMNFYIDESGHTGLNLFDNSQPVLYYGMISSPFDLNITARPFVERLRAHFDVDRLHANKLGAGRILSIYHKLEAIKRKNKISVDIFKIFKKDYAAISFFDQIFDQGVNKAVPWSSYETPLRYILLQYTAMLWDEKSLKASWDARLEKNNQRSNEMLKSVLEVLLSQVSIVNDARAREIITDAFRWAIRYPDAINYNSADKKYDQQISPNLIGFQSVLHGISARLKDNSKTASSIIVDRQKQFNIAQQNLIKYYQKAKDYPQEIDTGLPMMDLQHIPESSISCVPGTDNIGLELVDIYLWLSKKILEEDISSPKLDALIDEFNDNKYNNEISIRAITNRWQGYFESLPPLSETQEKEGKALKEILEKRRKENLIGL